MLGAPLSGAQWDTKQDFSVEKCTVQFFYFSLICQDIIKPPPSPPEEITPKIYRCKMQINSHTLNLLSSSKKNEKGSQVLQKIAPIYERHLYLWQNNPSGYPRLSRVSSML